MHTVTWGPALYERLRDSAGGLVLTIAGDLIDEVDTSILEGPTLLVAPVSDSVKEVSSEGVVVAHLDRAVVWQVVAFYLDAAICRRLASEDVDFEQIHQFVIDHGPGWDTRPAEEVLGESSSLP